MASEASELVDKLTNGLLCGLVDELVNGDGFETIPHQFCDGGQCGRGGGHGIWCRRFKLSYGC